MEASLGRTLEAIKKLKPDTREQEKILNSFQVKLDDTLNFLHGKLDGHAKICDNLAKMMDDMPDHNAVMKRADGLLASHQTDHLGKMNAAINKLLLHPDAKV